MSSSNSKPLSQISASTFLAKSWQNDACSQNGLPLTPNSISILGRFQFLKTIEHRNLCLYIHLLRGKHERTIVISEFYGSTLPDVKATIPEDCRNEIIMKIFHHCVSGLDHLHELNIVHHNIEPSNILLDTEFNVKLFDYGLFYMTRNENDDEYVSFPIGNVGYLAPERVLGSHGNPKSDVWSIAMIIVELLFDIQLWNNIKFNQIVRKLLSYCNNNNNNGSVLQKLAKEHNVMDKYNNLDEDLRNILESCLDISSELRPSTKDILNNEIFSKLQTKIDFIIKPKPSIEKSPLEKLTLPQVFYLWELCGGDVHFELKKEGLIRSEAPILTVPRVVTLQNNRAHPIHKSQSNLFDSRIVILNTNILSKRLERVPKRAFYPLLHCPQLPYHFGSEFRSLPLVIRERNIEYQFYRIVLFERLLEAYPYTQGLIIEQAKIDIPPLLRGRIWSCLLNVLPNGRYNIIDKETPDPTDRQIEVDIPRCHQYDDFLSSPTGHIKLKRLLKAWVTAHPQYVYWQGLDSLTAPFLISNYNDEERAFLSLYNFIPKYLHNFFLKDNSIIIKEYLSKFFQLVMFHEPALGKHLNSINFIPELFAIPWVLTMFSHVFPLHKILHLWDKLILGDSSYPLFIGVAILRQLKTTLLDSGFNECILLFSDLPDIVMETCVIDSQEMYEKTPKSICHRDNVLRSEEPSELDIDTIQLSILQKEICPRISGNDLVNLLTTCNVFLFDLRPQHEYRRWHIEGSVNLPFTNLLLSDKRLESLNIDRTTLNDKIVVIISVSHDNACLFAEFLIECDIAMVSILHHSINLLHTNVPSIFVNC